MVMWAMLFSMLKVSRQKIFLSSIVLLFLSVPIYSQADTFTGKVVGVSDGDTISVMR